MNTMTTTYQSSRWCNPKLVTHSLQVAFSARRCRECVGVIERRGRYWRCCTECHPLCQGCFDALGPEARRLESVSPPTPAPTPAEPPPPKKRRAKPPPPGQMQLF